MKRSTQILLGFGYVLFFSISCCVSVYFLAPYHRVRDVVVQEIERPRGPTGDRRPSGRHLSIGSLSPTWIPGGAILEDVHLRVDPETPDGNPLEVEFDRVVARVGLFGLLFGTQSFSFEAETGGGSIEGSYSNSDTETQITGHLERVSLARLGVLEGALGLPLEGRLGGDIELTLAEERADTEGEVSLTIRNLVIGDGVSKLAIPNFGDGVTIPEIEAGDVELDLRARNGVAEVRKFEGNGEDLELRGSGSLQLSRPVQTSRLDVLLRVAFAEEFKDQDETAERLMTVLEMLPVLRDARTSDGAIQYQITGPIGGRIATRAAGSASLD